MMGYTVEDLKNDKIASGYRYVYYDPGHAKGRPWRACIVKLRDVPGVKREAGFFTTPIKAAIAIVQMLKNMDLSLERRPYRKGKCKVGHLRVTKGECRICKRARQRLAKSRCKVCRVPCPPRTKVWGA